MKRLNEPLAQAEGQLAPTLPVVIDLGKLKRKAAKKLKRAEGALPGKVQAAVDEVLAGLGAEAEGKTILPVVVLFEKKAKKSRPFSIF